MNIQDLMVKLSKYGVACRMVEDAFLITLKFDKDWVVIAPEDSRVQCKRRNDTYYYAAKLDNSGPEAVFKAIEATISYNESLSKRKKLLDVKIKELCKLFAEHEDLDELETLKFVLDKRRRKKHKKVDESLNVVNDITVVEDNLPIMEVEDEEEEMETREEEVDKFIEESLMKVEDNNVNSISDVVV